MQRRDGWQRLRLDGQGGRGMTSYCCFVAFCLFGLYEKLLHANRRWMLEENPFDSIAIDGDLEHPKRPFSIRKLEDPRKIHFCCLAFHAWPLTLFIDLLPSWPSALLLSSASYPSHPFTRITNMSDEPAPKKVKVRVQYFPQSLKHFGLAAELRDSFIRNEFSSEANIYLWDAQ